MTAFQHNSAFFIYIQPIIRELYLSSSSLYLFPSFSAFLDLDAASLFCELTLSLKLFLTPYFSFLLY